MSAPESLQFRTAVAADVLAIVELVNSAYRGDSSREGWTTEADLLGGQRTDQEMMSQVIEDPASRFELAFQEGRLVGCVHLKREPRGACYLGMLSVAPRLQAQGLGSALLLHGERVAREWECGSIRMTVIQRRTELLGYYERRGYRTTGVTLPFPASDPRFGLPKVPLHFLELAKAL